MIVWSFPTVLESSAIIKRQCFGQLLLSWMNESLLLHGTQATHPSGTRTPQWTFTGTVSYIVLYTAMNLHRYGIIHRTALTNTNTRVMGFVWGVGGRSSAQAPEDQFKNYQESKCWALRNIGSRTPCSISCVNRQLLFVPRDLFDRPRTALEGKYDVQVNTYGHVR